MTLQMNLGNTFTEHYSFKSYFHIPYNFTGSCIISNSLLYYKNGKKHREDGPAIEANNGDKDWYLYGKRHRIGGPAIEYAGGGYKVWFINGLRHRADGPAVERADGKAWYLNDQLHREDGPAVECADGGKVWWINGKKYGRNNDFTNESWKHFQRTLIF